MTVKTSQKCPCVHSWFTSQNGQLTGFDHYSYLPLKSSYSRGVKQIKKKKKKPCETNPGDMRMSCISLEDNQRILIETSSCNLQFFSGLITGQLRNFTSCQPRIVFTSPRKATSFTDMHVFNTFLFYIIHLLIAEAKKANQPTKTSTTG